jgi:hypothetical protein
MAFMTIGAPVSAVERSSGSNVINNLNQEPSSVLANISSQIAIVRDIASATITVLANKERAALHEKFHGRRATIRAGGRITTNDERRSTKRISIVEKLALQNIKMTAARRFKITRETPSGLFAEMENVLSKFNDFLDKLEHNDIKQKTKKEQILRTKNVAIASVKALKALGVKR